MAEHSSRGDPKRTMALLWGDHRPPTRGPKPGLQVADIIAVAIDIADAQGLSGVSMRKVGDRLGKSAMTLYTYVPGRSELLDLMLDRALAELATDPSPGTGWRAGAEASARAEWSFYERHPWVLHVSRSRSVLGPNELDAYEAQLRPFDRIGLSAVEIVHAAAALSCFVRGSARAVADAREAEAATGITDADWWSARSPLLQELSGDLWHQRWPIAARLGNEHAFDQRERTGRDTASYTVREAINAFEFGLTRLLDGIETTVARRRGRRQGRKT